MPASVLDHLRKQIPEWQSIGYLEKKHPKKKVTCVDRSLHKQKSTWSHGSDYACDSCQPDRMSKQTRGKNDEVDSLLKRMSRIKAEKNLIEHGVYSSSPHHHH